MSEPRLGVNDPHRAQMAPKLRRPGCRIVSAKRAAPIAEELVPHRQPRMQADALIHPARAKRKRGAQ
eukprot:7608312-Pyramimonas_sp.AAC.1